MKRWLEWFKKNGLNPLPFQKKAWETIANNESGLIISHTGSGKTYAAFLPLLDKVQKNQGLQILYIAPLKSLSQNLIFQLEKPIKDLNLDYEIQVRTSDTSQALRQKQKKKLPEVLVTTPESLSLLLSYPTANHLFKNLKGVIVDEWHELMDSKRGTYLLLALSLLPRHQTWGLSATIGNSALALEMLVPENGILIQAESKSNLLFTILSPSRFEELPWSGRTGLKFAERIANHLTPDRSVIIFTNTRMHAERWYEELKLLKAEESHLLALHHSSIDLKKRQLVEEGLKSGAIRWVIATSSLDLGLDFPLVEEVIQIGSPKTVKRMVQRGGRAKHQPMHPSPLTILPVNPMDLIEIEGLITLYHQGIIEAPTPPELCYDTLIQHLTLSALSAPFQAEDTFKRVKNVWPYRNMTQDDFRNVLHFLTTGGSALKKYPDFHKLKIENGLYTISDEQLGKRLRMQAGVIPSHALVDVKLSRGQKLGVVDEQYIARLNPGDVFLIGGKKVELTGFREGIARVKPSNKNQTAYSLWQGNPLSLHTEVGKTIREHITSFKSHPLKNLLEVQKKVSHLPEKEEFLIERIKTSEGYHLFFYPFVNRKIHQAIASLVAYRMSKQNKGTYLTTVNDMGFEILSNKPFDFDLKKILSHEHLGVDLTESLNLTKSAERRFRDIAHIGGLLFKGYPGKFKSIRSLQMSAETLFKVLKEYDPNNVLVHQAYQEARDEEFMIDKVKDSLETINQVKWIDINLKKLSPLSLPLFVESVLDQISTESLDERIERLLQSWS